MRCRRLIYLLLALLLFLPLAAMAELPCQCGETPCVCFLQEGDEGQAVTGAALLLTSQGYLSAGHAGPFDAALADAVRRFQADHALPETAMLDDATLTLLIWGMTPEELDLTRPDACTDAVWIPTGGGLKRHARPDCSNMISPRMMTSRNAAALGFESCKRCHPQ